jgi:APA family basic amino acid/polyamine antiporter
VTTILTGVLVALGSLIGDANETYDLTNIGTLFAFVLVCIGVLVLRYTEPERPRPFRVPFVWPVCLGGAAACLYVMAGLPEKAWWRFGWWLLIGLVIYLAYGYSHSTLRKAANAAPAPKP